MTSPRDPTQFTRESAERIANVVRAAELAPRAGRPLAFDRADAISKSKVFHIGTFTGAWPIGNNNTVVLSNQTTTLSVTNLFFPITEIPKGGRQCAIAKDGTAWYLIDVPLKEQAVRYITNFVIDDVITDVEIGRLEVVTDAKFEGCEFLVQKAEVVSLVKTEQVSDAVIVTQTATANVLILDLGRPWEGLAT